MNTQQQKKGEKAELKIIEKGINIIAKQNCIICWLVVVS